jgi:hypothetical protein
MENKYISSIILLLPFLPLMQLSATVEPTNHNYFKESQEQNGFENSEQQPFRHRVQHQRVCIHFNFLLFTLYYLALNNILFYRIFFKKYGNQFNFL